MIKIINKIKVLIIVKVQLLEDNYLKKQMKI